MIAAARALVSVIALDEEILLSFKQQQSFDYHNIIFYILLGLFTGFISVYYSVTREWNNFLKVLNYHLIKKALFGSSILAILIFIFPTLLEKVMKVSKHYLITIREIIGNTLFSSFRDNSWALLVFVGLTMMLNFATGILLAAVKRGNFASLFLGSYVGFFFSNL
jgi:CIC family chloride channel protein